MMAVRRMLVADRYRLREPVGSGGMGRVWLARDEVLDRDVAVKEFVPPEWMTVEEQNRLRDRTLREARSAGRLNHPHVVRVFDVVHEDDQPWIIMEYVPSRSLYQVITDDGPYSPGAAARIGLSVLDALTAAHRAGVLHRDVKPHNVLIGTDGRVVLTDFGLATFVDDGSVTGPGLVVGSPQYVSPERARDGASTVESDLWSFGATLYAAVEGRSPYARENAMATLMALATEEPDPTERAGLLEPVLMGLLRQDPAARLTAIEVERRLRMIIAATSGGLGIPAQRTGGTVFMTESDGTGLPRPVAGHAAARVPSSSAASAPLPAPAHPRPRLVAAGLVAVALLTVAGVVASYLVRRDAPTAAAPAPSAISAPGPAATGFSSAVCRAPAPSNAPRLPQKNAARGVIGLDLYAGWSFFTDGTGFHMPVPDGWTSQKVGTTYCFRDTYSSAVLSLDFGRNPAADPVKACVKEEARLIAQGALPGYQKIKMVPTPLLSKAADWEYTYEGPSGVVFHSRTRWFATGGKAYAISWASRELEWPNDAPKLIMVLANFYADQPLSTRPG
jgi:tRNA A-37 threonylcarbamoyl transferase component Bud32